MKVPSLLTQAKFRTRWHKLQKAKDVEGMEALLQPEYLKIWWELWMQTDWKQCFYSTCKGAVELILQRMNLIGTPPERPSERAMRIASAKMKSERVQPHFYRDVPGLGHVALSRHAQLRLREDGIGPDMLEDILLRPTGPDKPDGQTTIWREKNGVRLVILLPDQPSGARLMVTAYKIKGPASAKRC